LDDANVECFRTADGEALHWAAVRLDPTLALHRRWQEVDWTEGHDAIRGLFGIDRPAHFLNQPPGVFQRLREPQITKALQALILNAPGRTLERAQGLFNAVLGADAPRLASVSDVTADDETRMDLAVHAIDVDGVARCLVLEAKFEYELSDAQLAKYRRRLIAAYPTPGRRHLYVVAPRQTDRTIKVMARPENSEWSFVTWTRLLLNWQRSLPGQPGTDVAALFGEIWKRAGGQ
jgi:hypothetical protein